MLNENYPTYDNTAAVSDGDAILSTYQQQSASVYLQYNVQRNIAYGDNQRERLDWFRLNQGARRGVFIFIHGGYWQSCTKEDFAIIVPHIMTCGFEVILLEYSLVPDVSLTELVVQIGKSLDFISQHAEIMSAGKAHFILAGHSAGAHLSAYWQDHHLIDKILLISGIFDLAPLTHTQFNHKLQLSRREIDDLSPIFRQISAKPITIIVGADELPELVMQSQTYYQKVIEHYEKPEVQLILLPDTNHFTILTCFFDCAKQHCLLFFNDKALACQQPD